MDKKQFLTYFLQDNIEDAARIYDKYKLAMLKGITLYTKEFYTPEVWMVLQKFSNADVSITCYGVFEESERRLISFNNYGDYPIDLIKITVNNKFTTLTHRDFLGSIMSLGVTRNRIGDLIVKDNYCYFPVHKEVTSYILTNLLKIRNSPCKCEVVGNFENIPKINYEERNINVKSLRLDCLVSAISNESRNNACALISSGKVLVNYAVEIEKSKELKLESKLTIRGVGKFIIKEVLGNSKSGRLKLKILKYS